MELIDLRGLRLINELIHVVFDVYLGVGGGDGLGGLTHWVSLIPNTKDLLILQVSIPPHLCPEMIPSEIMARFRIILH